MLKSLSTSKRLPVIFLGHGSPMNAIEDTPYRQAWQALGARFGSDWPKPQLILCVSAHWLTPGWWLTAMAAPPTIHDFGGFPQALFDQRYTVPGFPQAALELAEFLRQPHNAQPIGLDHDQWGLDHGAWGVIKPMFPAADIPVIQLSIAAQQPPEAHLALGAQLRSLREQGVLVLASGNIVHNLRTMNRAAQPDQAYEWAIAFDQLVAEKISAHDLDGLQQFEQIPHCAQAHPSTEHFLPLLYAAGATHQGETPQFFNTGFQGASISMRSVLWG